MKNEFSFENLTNGPEKGSDIFENIRGELSQKIKSYQNESAAYSSFTKETKLSKKTLLNFLQSKCTPYPSTLVSFYKWLFKADNEFEVFKQLTPEVKIYLSDNGYNFDAVKEDITTLVCKSTIHYEIYLMTEDQQVVKKSTIEKLYGSKGLDALEDLLLDEVIVAVDENTLTAGRVRSNEDVNYYMNASLKIAELLPWSAADENIFDSDIGYTLGNIIAAKQDRAMLDKAFLDFKKKLCEIHARGMRTEKSDRESFVYSTLLYKPASEREIQK